LWVLGESGFKRKGYFVEFGATNGVAASNTWLLENFFDWNGILVEPNLSYHAELVGNRTCNIDSRVVWDESNKTVSFLQLSKPYLSVAKQDLRLLKKEELENLTQIDVETITLTELLKQYEAPHEIDFISVDVEGSEERVLRAFFHDREYIVNLFSIEHNYRDPNESLLRFMLAQGYERVYPEHSGRDYWLRRV